ncbi:MAG TPA: sigma-54-dependent Fis family transcriptional regulator [Spirochaetaceae bacterium]|nr:sigma-54-dependent Fis family transcriptional regulator [Spirochaetaceae bacterium]HAW85948.1 sigma-54-dependent Fis family transcriptional regulator [Spirochaetaceae bacterium]HAX38108.1 sigma-54-dependent Fis family transcriptional regulator [Spirochaetaceae bacterium]HBO40207.1 sigma-54-dependent Fis family transcriptional regulator [Spirochaetaceae bacterium]HCQ85858.1 sigma-54-dependent Fis family transcriptional regulator [Spirochaetaceae bacterium]
MACGAVIHLGQGLAGRVYETGQAAGQGCRWCVPLLEADKVVGLLGAGLAVGSELPAAALVLPEALAFLAEVASLLAVKLHLRRQLVGLTSRPPLAAGSDNGVAGWVSVAGEKALADDSTAADGSVALAALASLGRSPFGHLIGTSAAMQAVFQLLSQVAATEATVLILGESGTGKELCAADIHRGSRRARQPFIKVNCAALPESVIESELFGHEKGAFTGAVGQRKGRFELADGGTIFLDEIGDLSPAVQVKLLRVLQEREFERVGGSRPLPLDVRVIAATNRQLEAEVAAGRFRADLFYRLNVFPLQLPPLRQRKSDIMLLADWFVAKYATRNHKRIARLSSPAIDLLTSYHWPGNVRELENCVERAVILSSDAVIHAWHLPPSLQSAASTHTEPASTLEAALARLERELIVEALKLEAGNMAASARRLGISERQMGLRVHHYAIDWRAYRRGR